MDDLREIHFEMAISAFYPYRILHPLSVTQGMLMLGMASRLPVGTGRHPQASYGGRLWGIEGKALGYRGEGFGVSRGRLWGIEGKALGLAWKLHCRAMLAH